MWTFLSFNSTTSPGSPITRLMKSRSGSSGYLKTRMSPRRIGSIGNSFSSTRESVGANTNLLTRRWSPMSRLFSIDPVGILTACTTKVLTKSARITATQIDSKYSRAVDLRNEAPAFSFSLLLLLITGAPSLLGSDFQNRKKSLLRDLDSPDPLHPLLAFLLLLEQLPLPGDVTTITFGEHVLAQGFHALARNDPVANGRLDGDLKHLTRDEFAHLRGQGAATVVRGVAVNDDRKGIDRLAVHQDIHLDQRRFPVAGHVIVERGIPSGQRLELVVEIEHPLVEGELIGDQHAVRLQVLQLLLDSALVLTELQDATHVLGRRQDHRRDDG